MLCLELIAGTSIRVSSLHFVSLSISYIMNCLCSCMFDLVSECVTLKKEANSRYTFVPKQTSDSNLYGFNFFSFDFHMCSWVEILS